MAQHNILLLDIKDPLVLAGAHVKQCKHPNAEAYTVGTIKNATWAKTGPWKLHVIGHGSPGKISGTTSDKVAEYARDSNLPNKTGAVIKLDSCFGGVGARRPSSTDPHVNTGSMVAQVKTSLSKKNFYGTSCKIAVQGAYGQNVLGWDIPEILTKNPKTPIRGLRMVIDPGHSKTLVSYKIKYSVDPTTGASLSPPAKYSVLNPESPAEQKINKEYYEVMLPKYQTKYQEALKTCATLALKTTPNSTEILNTAKAVYTKIGALLREYYAYVKTHTLFIDKLNKSGYKYQS